jgi:hypothetical protein
MVTASSLIPPGRGYKGFLPQKTPSTQRFLLSAGATKVTPADTCNYLSDSARVNLSSLFRNL